MKKYGLNELRKMYLEFFESKNHLVVKSFSLVPHNDNSLLLINSGMAPLKPYFTGQEIPPRKRVTTCQKCIRTGDIENVGKTARHGTFFEMLGNFSFGDYFKKEAIQWSWEFITEVVGLESDRLYPSVFEEDDEAFRIWNEQIEIPENRIFRFGREEDGSSDNFWEHGAGPCGPSSEIFYDRGEKYGCGKPDCTVGCECDRYMEVWNNVFTQFNGDGNGHYEELAQKNIDTGLGLERLAVAVQDVDTIFDVDTLKALRDKVCEYADVFYNSNADQDVSIRLITDHIRSATFMISDGIMPSNEGRGYVLRRLIRRAARHGRLLNINNKFLAKLSETVIAESKDGYPELDDKKDMIFKVLTEEENKFNKTIDQGLTILNEMQTTMAHNNSTILSGENAFKLYDTYGFPLDLTKEILAEKDLEVDEAGFNIAMEEQRVKARNARKATNYMGTDASIYEELDPMLTTEFVGYDTLTCVSDIIAMVTSDEVTAILSEGQEGTIFVNVTPFYAAMGGQDADKGVITFGESQFLVTDTIKLSGGKVGHVGTVAKGTFQIGNQVELSVDETIRNATAKNHSATHLLQKALKVVLGNHVEQAGSFVTAERLRFDFTHFSAMTKEEVISVEAIVNEQILKAIPVDTKVMSIEEAKKTGAMALFGEKYGDNVRVVSMGDFSSELCGGTHVKNTNNIGLFKIISEAGIAAGIRRIEALTAAGTAKYYADIEHELFSAAKTAKTEPNSLVKKIEAMQEEMKALHQENNKLKNKLANDSLGDIMNQVREIKSVKFLAAKINDVDMNGLRNLGDKLKDQLGDGVVLLASSQGIDKVSLVAFASEAAMSKGAHAGNLIKNIVAIVDGGGGGRPNMAQAGGKRPDQIDAALEKATEVLTNQL